MEPVSVPKSWNPMLSFQNKKHPFFTTYQTESFSNQRDFYITYHHLSPFSYSSNIQPHSFRFYFHARWYSTHSVTFTSLIKYSMKIITFSLYWKFFSLFPRILLRFYSQTNECFVVISLTLCIFGCFYLPSEFNLFKESCKKLH